MSESIAIVGAGLAGAVLSQRLSAAGLTVTLYEKSRGTGGRMASCRLEGTSADLGAALLCATPDTPFFQWLQQQDTLQHWHPITEDFEGNALSWQGFVARDRMSRLTRALATGATLHTGTRISYIWPTEDGVILRDEHGHELATHNHVIVTTPAAQAVPLLEAVPRFAKRAEKVDTAPAWVSILVLSAPSGIRADLLQGEHPILARALCQSRIAGRSVAGGEIWQLEARADWSATQRDLHSESVGQELLRAFNKLAAAPLQVAQQRTHRWLYSHTLTAHTDATYLWSAESQIGACGDWFGTHGALSSWESANALADHLLSTLAH